MSMEFVGIYEKKIIFRLNGAIYVPELKLRARIKGLGVDPHESLEAEVVERAAE